MCCAVQCNSVHVHCTVHHLESYVSELGTGLGRDLTASSHKVAPCALHCSLHCILSSTYSAVHGTLHYILDTANPTRDTANQSLNLNSANPSPSTALQPQNADTASYTASCTALHCRWAVDAQTLQCLHLLPICTLHCHALQLWTFCIHTLHHLSVRFPAQR